jgi:manganese/zinc/iron transport system substrate-binding protein
MRYAAILLLIAFTAGCRIRERRTGVEPRILCSTTIVADCISEIVGDTIRVEALMGPGVDPHSYKARPSDIAALNEATVIVYSGLHLEGKMFQLFEKLHERKPVFAVSSAIPAHRLIPTSDAGTYDPHIWFDTEIWLDGLQGIVSDLEKEFPARKSDFQASFLVFRKKIEIMHRRLKLALAEVPAGQRVLITSHDAFHYFGRHFGIEVKALQGISTTQEPGVKDVADLVNFIVDRKIRAIFVEHSVSPKAIRSVIESCARKGWKVRIGGTLYSDALGDAESSGNTYENMLRHNVETIIKGLK